VSLLVRLLVEVALEPYLPLAPATLLYRSPTDEILTVEVLPVQIEGAPAAVRMGSDRRRRIESFHPEDGLRVHRLGLGRSGELVYETPLVILPAMMEPGAIHSSESRFSRKGSFLAGPGLHSVEAELLAVEDLELGSDVHPDCLRIRRRETRTEFDGSQEIYQATEWYARKIGLVKVSGERLEKDGHGETLSIVSIRLSLVTSAEP
jgi:hypothetical protein